MRKNNKKNVTCDKKMEKDTFVIDENFEKKIKEAIKENISMYYKAIEPKYNCELLNMLNETRGVIDNLTPLINKIVKYIREFIKDDTFIDYLEETNDEKQYYRFSFTIPKTIFTEEETLFIVDPIFHINLFVSYNRFPDYRYAMGETYYNCSNDIKSKDGKIVNPEFFISITANNNLVYDENFLSSNLRHELTHFYGNLKEFFNNNNALSKKMAYRNMVNSITDEDEVIKILKRIFYLIDQDEINARAHQLYTELEPTMKNTYLETLKEKIQSCYVYDSFMHEFDKYITILQHNVRNPLFSKSLVDKFKFRHKGPVGRLLNTLIFAKNKQIVQFQKVAEKWYYEKLTIKMY